MAQLPFSMPLMRFLADHRSPFLTKLFLFSTFVGEVDGYIFIATLIYVMFDKRLAVRLSILVLFTMAFNHLLKIIIKNPRPFIREGTYTKQWAVSADNARELATEYSTPSGHAMAASAFYSYLYGCVENRYVRVVAIITILLTGLSRPYLGVHYLEDVILGWMIGLSIALVALKYVDEISERWNKLSYRRQVTTVVISSMMLWLVTIVINGWRIDGQPRAFMGYTGFLTGIVIAVPVELKKINFDPRSAGVVAKILRYLMSMGMVIVTLLLLGTLFTMMADKFSLLGYVLQYVRYTIAGIVSILIAPLCFTYLGLAERSPMEADAGAFYTSAAVSLR